jgi:hypothetical protein
MFNLFKKKKTQRELDEESAQELYLKGKVLVDKYHKMKARVDDLFKQIEIHATEYSMLCTKLDNTGGKTPDHWKMMKEIRAGLDNVIEPLTYNKGMN